MTTANTQQPRKAKPQTVLEVVRTTRLNDWMQRVTVGGPGFADFVPNDSTDAYVKLVFVKPELGLTPPYDMAVLREELDPDDRPITRTYTIRSIDAEAGTLDIDFVIHGEEGYAGPWAAKAQPGDQLVLLGPGGGYAPDAAADFHLLVGDSSALPAIAAALESLPADARGLAIVALDHEAERQEVAHPAGVELVWHVEAGTAADTERLAGLVTAREWPEGDVQVFAHGERETIKALRRVFREREVPRERLSISGYWALGRTEDRFQAEKREPIGKID
ncbi:siderophore-interacting protein [Gulosibacter sp. ACHW.36C]|uniref:Siderophore-interacting protein n=1 Tax=Gulosibacter sediminis TaxID=1729695 RepID=A0ABY4MY24_9MICO|nr:siderophore-interacting protein [Gulosibacter sediminis]UQN15332.1 siderophore-interacting protein [Gulosibacter sediminis]